MNLFQERDYELIEEAKKTIYLNYDQEHYNHTVGAAIRCKNGKVYAGVRCHCVRTRRTKKIRAKELLPLSYSVE